MGDEDCFEGLYHFLKVLGEGSFGKAVLYRRYTDNFLVVWKEVICNNDIILIGVLITIAYAENWSDSIQ